MTLEEFLAQTQSEVHSLTSERLGSTPYPYAESVFTEVVMQHMADIGMTSDPQVIYIRRKVGNATLRLSGYALSEDGDQLDLFVSIYEGVEELVNIPEADVKSAVEQCLRFLTGAVTGKLASSIDQTDDSFGLILTLRECYDQIDTVRIYVLTDQRSKAKSFKPREISGKLISIEVMDIERLYRHWSEGKPRDELLVDFNDVAGTPLPCVYVPGEANQYDYALTAIPGSILRLLYEKFGARLLEANVRSFLSQTGKVNKGIRDTLRLSPEKFMAFNNGIVIVADEVSLGKTSTGGEGIAWLRGMQIVNGGQTTASIYFTKRRFPDTDLSQVRVPAKVIVLRSSDEEAENKLLADISKFANSQNSVRVSDLSANRPFHVELERLSLTVFCPDGVGRWFYERAAGSYNVMLAREGTTLAKLRDLKDAIPSARRFTKTDVAKYRHTWDQRPDLVALGSEKNFKLFSEEIEKEPILWNNADYKHFIGLVILYKRAEKIARSEFQQAQANITAYTLALISKTRSSEVDFETIWQNQKISAEFERYFRELAAEIYRNLKRFAGEKMIAEAAKKSECWAFVAAQKYPEPTYSVPELRGEISAAT